MKKAIFYISFLFAELFTTIQVFSQLASELNYPVPCFKVETWDANWITCEDGPQSDDNVSLFRRTIAMYEKPEKYIVHVSADNRYKLFVNGILVAIGPQLSDIRHQRYETIDIAPYLTKGKNVIAAEVVNWGVDRHFGIISLRTGFLIQGFSSKEAEINTDNRWKATQNNAYRPLPPNWIFGVDIVGGFYASNPGDSLIMSQFPSDWNSVDYDDSNWPNAKWIWRASNENQGGHIWLMKPRTTPQVAQLKERFGKIARTVNITVDNLFLSGKKPLIVPSDSKVSVLLDFQKVILGFPELLISGGISAKITITYAENLMYPDFSKGDRNVVEGKSIRGLHDVIMCDGRKNFLFSPTWYRAFRYVQLDIETNADPLTILDFYNMTTLVPLQRKAVFKCNDSVYEKIDEICWHTARICTQDNLMSDAYYEQMMYVGDTKVHALVNLYMTGEDIWLKNAIEQFSFSRLPNGLLTSCYPLKASFYLPNFSLIWIDMIHDYMMYCRDREFVRSHAEGIKQILQWFEENKLGNGLIGGDFGTNFVDWYNDPPFAGRGMYPGSLNGNSAVVSLQYAATLLRAAEIFDYLDLPADAAICRNRASKIKKDVYAACWDNERKLFAETPDRQFYDERANIMAIAARMFDPDWQKDLFLRCLADTSISKAGYYFRYHHFEEMRKLGLGDSIDKVLDIWKLLLPIHLTTTPERQARQRSDAHPWSASPAMAFLHVIAGISPAEPEFRSVSIEPALGNLNYISASYPHYLGNIKVNLRKTNAGKLEGSIELPKGLNGTFRYKGCTIFLPDGVTKVCLPR